MSDTPAAANPLNSNASPIQQLLDVMRQLRDPHTGCAWDIEQTFKSIAPYTIEEAYEVADAIERDDLLDLKDELGDLLLQVVFHAQMAAEQNSFAFDDVARAIVEKLIRRHPHVFGGENNRSSADVKQAWESVKAAERAAKGRATAASALDDIAHSLPALMRADKVQKRAARVGFDWTELPPVWDKLHEELDEVREAAAAKDADALEDELGDALFAIVNLARHYHVDAEVALQRASRKFEQRFRQVEVLAAEQGRALSEMDLAGLDELWNAVKRQQSREE